MQEDEGRRAQRRTQTVCLLVLTAIASGVALMQLRSVLVPFVLALFLSTATVPLLDVLHVRMRFPRGLAMGTAVAIATFVLLFLGGLVSSAISEVLAKDQVYIEQVTKLVSRGEATFIEVQARFDGWFEHDGDGGTEPAGEEPDAAGELDGTSDLPAGDSEAAALSVPGKQKSPPSPIDDLQKRIPEILGNVIGWVVNSGLALVSQGALVLVFMMFLIIGYRAPEDRDPTTLWAQVRRQIIEYVRVKTAVSFMTGASTFLILKLLGVDLALVFGTMAFFLNFIPNIGSLVAMTLPIPVVLLAPPEQLDAVDKTLALALPAGVQLLMGNFVEPRWMGRSLDLHPVVVLLALIFWGFLWGPIGMLLSVPITAVIKTLLERSDLTRPAARLLADRP